MKVYTLFVLCASAFLAANGDDKCTVDNCAAASGCICPSKNSPLPLEDTPQFIVLTFDDVVRDDIYMTYYEPILFDRVNPDSNPISATFFVPHEYTNYTRVNDLYNRGFEIGVNSITKNPLASYWASASVDELVAEFGGSREIISTFANIPAEDIKGARTPNLQLAGNNTFEALKQIGLSYDNSWPTGANFPLFPYTLDHLSSQICWVGSCPTGPFPGIFVSPIINFRSQIGIECNSIFGCQVSGTTEELLAWMIAQFEAVYKVDKAPQTWNINSVWFVITENAMDAYSQFLDHLASLPDVFLVSHDDVHKWMLNPVPLSSYTNPPKERNAECQSQNCRNLPFGTDQTRSMGSCVTCPTVYPWLGNPSGSV